MHMKLGAKVGQPGKGRKNVGIDTQIKPIFGLMPAIRLSVVE
jgi:hypothetical protein